MSLGPPLDFEALLSREHRPARVTRLVIRDGFVTESVNKGIGGTASIPKKDTFVRTRRMVSVVPREDYDGISHNSLPSEMERDVTKQTSRLVLSLVTQTPAFAEHLKDPASSQLEQQRANLVAQTAVATKKTSQVLEPAFHEVELGDWESKIRWDGIVSEDEDIEATTADTPNNTGSDLLQRRRNFFLDNIQFDSTTVSWDGDCQDLFEKAQRAPLILELGVAGRSIAKQVYQHTVLSAQRPLPALQSEAYRQRIERSGNLHHSSGQDAQAKRSLHADKDAMEALIEARQRKRAQMAKDKTNRVMEAMGTMALGGGRGRTITSSLMGPGGTERTGRPTRASATSVAHDSEYVEQLDLVVNHTLVRDLSKVVLRQYHRPKLPLSVVRPDLPWQFQIRFQAQPVASAKGAASGGGGVATGTDGQSYMMMMGSTTPGTLSRQKLRVEADLSPTEGHLILTEYTEERPPIQLTKGMAFKIVNYYRGDKSRCPVSKGGGDRPAARRRRKEQALAASASSSQAGTARRLTSDTSTSTILDWIGPLPKKSKDRVDNESIDVLPEGITEMLHPKVHGPFIGEVEEGQTLIGLISNLFVAPMVRHVVDETSTDFLMILSPPSGAQRAGQRENMGVVLRDLPVSLFSVGQTLPRARVFAPNTQGEKNFIGPFVSFQIARALSRTQAREGHGLRFDELQDRVLPNLEIPGNALRQRLKQVAVYDKNTQIWTTKPIGFESYPGVEALGKSISPEGVAAFETACAASRRLSDLGIHQLLERGSHTVISVGVAMVYLAGQLNAARELARKTKKLLDLSRSNKTISPLQIAFYEKAAGELEESFKSLRQRYEVAQFIFEEIQLAPWHLTGEYIDVHRKGEGTGMMKLTGLGDPSGRGEGFSFIREVDSKPNKSFGNAALNAQVKKITGTEDDLRKLTMKQMAALLRSYGMAQKQIDTLKRWDRVHVIRDLSTKAASDGIGDGLERFARGEKMKLSEQKQMYRDRVQVIWRRQLAALAASSEDRGQAADSGAAPIEGEIEPNVSESKVMKDDDDSDDGSDDDDLAAAFEDDMMDRSEANQLVATHATGGAEGLGGLGKLRAAAQDQDLTKDARELAALKRQREEERAAQEGMQTLVSAKDDGGTAGMGRKVIRKRITKTYPDGRQVTTFKFVLHPEEVGKIMAKLQQNPESARPRRREFRHENDEDEKPPGHAMFEDDDDFDYSQKGRLLPGGRRLVVKTKKRVSTGRMTPRARPLQIGKLKPRVSKEDRMRKRKREEEELEVYNTVAKRKGTNNRRERGSIRDRRPHVIYAEKLEAIRALIEARPDAGPFLKPVNRRLLPRYYEVISHPVDLQTIRDRIGRYEYRSVDTLLRDFELMKNNAIKFNGEASPIAQEAVSIYNFVKDKVEAQRDELTALEVAVTDQMGSGERKQPKIKVKGSSSKSHSRVSGSHTAKINGIDVNLGDLSGSALQLDGVESDSDDSFDADLD